jgi:hypothetical protein
MTRNSTSALSDAIPGPEREDWKTDWSSQPFRSIHIQKVQHDRTRKARGCDVIPSYLHWDPHLLLGCQRYLHLERTENYQRDP